MTVETFSVRADAPINVVKRADGIEVWHEGDEVHSLFTPDCFAYHHWLVIAERIAQQK